MVLPALSPEAYTVGWITILAEEFNAARDMLDEEHEMIFRPPDPYPYAPGCINGHCVVIARTGEAGPEAAGNCAARMQASFPGIKFGLLVGIGGGVPSAKHDIRLGDVVVSKHSHGHGGVVSYIGTHLQDDGVKYHRHLDRPPPTVAHAVDFMESDWERGDRTLQKYLAEMKSRHYASRDGLIDELYSEHDLNTKVERLPRQGDDGPRIHYGLIASGPWVIKTSGSRRTDLLSRIQGDVLCFEMEATGLMNTFPCLVVRGISDYCDSHKNDHKDAWHKYASATAACYAKWLLRFMSPRRVLETQWSAPGRDDQAQHTDIKTILRPSYFDIDRDLREKNRCLDTGDWILQDDSFLQWQGQQGNATLFLFGIPGSGKSFLMLRLLEQHRNLFFSGNRSLTYFFCDSKGKDNNKKSAVGVLRSLIAQILRQMRLRHSSKVPKILEGFEDFAKTPLGDISLENLLAVFISCLQLFDENYVLIDALDECSERTKLLECLQQARDLTGRRFLAILSSQDIAAVPYNVKNILSPVFEIRIDSTSQKADVERYIDWRMKSIDARHLGTGQEAGDSVKSHSKGYFLLAQVSCNALQNDVPVQLANPTKKIDRFPVELTEYFQRTLKSLSGSQKRLARDFYSWIAFSRTSLTPVQVTVAMNVAAQFSAIQSDEVHGSTLDRLFMGLIEAENGKLKFGHATISDFVLAYSWGEGPMSSLAQKEASINTNMALVCIEYLSSREALKHSASHEASDELMASKLPLLEYASQNWMEHVTASELDEPILARTKVFLESEAGLMWWIRYMRHRDIDDWWTLPRFAGLVKKWYSGSVILPDPSGTLVVQLGEKRLEWIRSEETDDDRLQEAAATLKLASHHEYNDCTRKAEKILHLVLSIVGASKATKLVEIKVHAMNHLASIMEDRGFFDKALSMTDEAMNLLKSCGSTNMRLFYDLKRRHAETRKNLGFFAEARRAQEENLKAAEVAPNDPYTLGIRNALALSCLDCEDLDAAEELLDRRVFARTLGADHPSTLTGLSNLAHVYKRQGKIRKAHMLLEDVFNRRKEMSGAKTSSTLMAALDLADTCAYLGQLARCRELRLYVKQSFDEVERTENDTFSLITHLANAEVLEGDLDAAHKRLSDYLAKLNSCHGSTHPWTINIKLELASTLSRQGRLAEADSQRRAVLERQKKSLMKDHPWTLATEILLSDSPTSREGIDARVRQQESCLERLSGFPHFYLLKRSFQTRLANSKYDQGLYAEAETIQAKLCSEWRRSGDDWSRDLIAMEIDLAHTKCKRGNFRDAEALVTSVLQRRLAMGDPDWPAISSTRSTLAFIHDGHGKLQQASALRKSIWENLKSQAKDPLAILDAKETYAKSLGRLGHLHESLKYLEEVRYERGLLPHTSGSTTALCLENIALTKWLMDRYGDVEDLMRQIIDIRRDTDGERSPSFLVSKENQAVLWRDMGELEKSEKAMREVWIAWKELAGPRSYKSVDVQETLVGILRKMGRDLEAGELSQLAIETTGPRSKLQLLESQALYAEKLVKDGKLEQAIEAETELLQEWRKVCDEDSIHILRRLHTHAETHSAKGNLEIAQQTLETLLEEMSPAFNMRGPLAIEVKTTLGEVLQETGSLDRAAEIQVDVLDARLDLAGSENHKTQWARWRLAQTRYKQERYEEAEALQAAVKTYFETAKPRDESSLREASLDYTRILCERGRFEDVQKCLASLLQREGDKTQRDNAEYEKILLEIGESYLKESKISSDHKATSEKAKKAQDMFEKVMQICQDRGEVQSESYQDARASLAIALYRQDLYEPAERLINQILEEKREAHGEDSVELLDTLAVLVNIKSALGKSDEVLSLLEKQLEIYENNDNEGSERCISVLSNLASIHFEEERYERAEEFQKRTVNALNASHLSSRLPELLIETKFLSKVTRKLKKLGETHVYLERALQMHKDLGEELSEACLDTLSVQAVIYYEENQLETAEKIEQEVVDRRAGLVDTRGKEQLATAVRSLIYTKARLGRVEDVKRLLDWDIDLRAGTVENLSESEFHDYLELMSSLSSFSIDMDDFRAAEWYQDRVMTGCLARDDTAQVSDEQLSAAKILATLNLKLNDEKAPVYLEKLVELYEKRGEDSSEECLHALAALSVCYYNADEFEKADRTEERIVNTRKLDYRRDQPELLINALASQVKTKDKLKQSRAVIDLLEQQVKIHMETDTIDSEQGREALAGLANTQFSMGNYVDAEIPQQALCRSLRSEEDSDYRRLLVALEELIVIQTMTEKYDEAHQVKTEQLQLLRKYRDTGSSQYISALSGQATIFLREKRAEEAEPILQEVLDGTRRRDGPDDATEDVLGALTRLAAVKMTLGRLEEALDLCTELVVLHQARGEDGEEDRTEVMEYLGALHGKLDHVQESIDWKTRVVEFRRRRAPMEKEKLCEALKSLGLSTVESGEFDKAYALFEEQAQLYRERGEESFADLIELQEFLVGFCNKLERTEEAQYHRQEADRVKARSANKNTGSVAWPLQRKDSGGGTISELLNDIIGGKEQIVFVDEYEQQWF